jgi:hypothetical protein
VDPVALFEIAVQLVGHVKATVADEVLDRALGPVGVQDVNQPRDGLELRLVGGGEDPRERRLVLRPVRTRKSVTTPVRRIGDHLKVPSLRGTAG